MPINDLTPFEREVVRRCLVAAVDGPYFPDWEFETLFGVTRVEVRQMVRAWPNVDESGQLVQVAINNAFVNLLGYPHHETQRLERETGVTEGTLDDVYTKWRATGKGAHG